MYSQVKQNQGSRNRRNDIGKQVPIFFPYHELGLIEDLDYQSHLELSNRSKYVRDLIKRDRQRVKEQSQQQAYSFRAA